MDVKELEALFQKKFDLMQAEMDKMKADHQADIDAQAAKFSEEKRGLETKLIEQEKTAKIEEFKAFCEAQVKDGKMPPAARDILVKDLDKINFSEGDSIDIPFDKFKAYMDKTSEILDKSEHGFHLPADQRGKKTNKRYYSEQPGTKLHDVDLDAEARKLMIDKKIGYSEALIEVLSANAELAEKFAETGIVGGDKE